MIRLTTAATISVLYATLAPVPRAEAPPATPPAGEPTPPEGAPRPTPEESPAIERARGGHLDALFERLADPLADDWEQVQAQIFEVWFHSGSDSMDLLLNRAREAIAEHDYQTALLHLDDLVRLAPEFAEGWNQRATVYFLLGDYGRSVRDIERVLALEPRHFGALAGLGIILDRTGNQKGAVRAYRRALEIHPHLKGAQEGIDTLAPEVDGREL